MRWITPSREHVRHTLQQVLQPDEQLLWSASPHPHRLRMPLFSSQKKGTIELLWNAVIALLLAGVGSLTFSFFSGELSFWSLAFFCFLFVSHFLSYTLYSFVRTFLAASKKAPPHWRLTLYALTTHRVLIIIGLPRSTHFPGYEPTVLSYRPEEIDLATNPVCAENPGILPFAPARQVKLGRYLPTFLLPGSFLGIASVPEVVALLRELASKSEIPGPRMAE